MTDAAQSAPLSDAELEEIEREHTPYPTRSGKFYCSCSEQIALAWPCFRVRAAATIAADRARLAEADAVSREALKWRDHYKERVAALERENDLLFSFAKHWSTCPAIKSHNVYACTCGLTSVAAAHNATLAPPQARAEGQEAKTLRLGPEDHGHFILEFRPEDLPKVKPTIYDPDEPEPQQQGEQA